MAKRSARQKVTAEEIKAIARQQMAAKGTAGISLRGIARELGVTAPAIYNYFAALDDLITALIVDAFNGLGDAVDEAVAAHAPHPAQQLRAGMMAYRAWAVANPASFQLIYGNPIPGYEAPSEVTVPLARRPMVAMYTQLLVAWQEGRLRIPATYEVVPESIAEFIDGWLYRDFPELAQFPKGLYLLMNSGWARVHGIVMLELFHHLPPALGDMDAFFQMELDTLMQQIGLEIV